MKIKIARRSKDEILKQYPIQGKTAGWYFRIDEVSNGVYEVEGTDEWGRIVHQKGLNPGKLLENCEADAKNINEKIKTTEQTFPADR